MLTDWDDHRYFLAIARSGTLTAAGKMLGVSQPTVSRRLDALETKLNVRLFDRARDGYALTDIGMQLFDTIRQVEEDLAGIARKISGSNENLTGAVRITCTEIFLNGYLSGPVWRFLHQHPGIDFSVSCTRSHLSLSRNEADLALRFTREPPETLAGRRLSSVAYCIYAARGSAGERFDATAREDWDWISIPDDNYNRMLRGAGMSEERIKHHVDSMAGIQSMVSAGLGVALLPCYAADRDPALRRLEPDSRYGLGLDLWLLYHPDIRRIHRVRLFAEFIAQQISADLDLFEGRRPYPDQAFAPTRLPPANSPAAC